MGLLELYETFKERANNPTIAGFNEPLLQYQQKKSKKIADYNQLVETLSPIYKEALAQNPDTNKEALAQSLVRAYGDNIESNFTQEEATAYNKYRQHRNIDPYSFKRLWDNAPKEKDSFLPAESFDNMQKWLNLIGANNLQKLQQTEINRLKQNRGQDFLVTASDMLVDPIGVMLPAGLISKVGGKGYNLLKSALGGSAIGAFIGGQELNRDDTELTDNLKNIALGAVAGGLLNTGLAAGLNKLTTGKATGVADTIKPQTAGVEISEAENLTPNKTTDPLLQKHLQEPTPQTNPTLVQSVEQILNDNTYSTPKKENTAGVEISEAENLNKDIEARANAFIKDTYAKAQEQEAMKEQRALQAIKAQSMLKGENFLTENPNLNKAVSNIQSYQIPQKEAEEIKGHFSFRNNKPLLREIRENEIAHALKSHGDEAKEQARGNMQ